MNLNDLKGKLGAGLLAALPVYQPLEPLPGQTSATYSSLGAYLNLVFKILLSIGGMIAVVTLVLGGITYMVSEVVDRKSEARKRMQAAIIGLLLLLVSWLILNTINPNLTVFNLQFGGPTNIANQTPSGNSSILPSSNPNDAVQNKTIPLNTYSGGGGVISSLIGSGLSGLGLYVQNPDLKTALGCGFSDFCALASSDYVSFGSGQDGDQKVKDFQQKCESGQFDTVGTVHGHVGTAPGDYFGDTGKTNMYCFTNAI